MFENRTVLVAGIPACIHTIQNVLGPNIKIIGATTLDEATQALNKNLALIVSGVRFNESRSMFDFLRIAKADPLFRTVPFLCFRDLDNGVGTPLCMLEGMKIACMALGAVDFVDLYDLKRLHGAGKADDLFHKILIKFLEDSK